MRFAIIENNVVVNTALGDGPIAANWIASDTAGVGHTYDPATGQFTAPAPQPAAPVRTLSHNAFMDRFTPAEQVAIYTAAQSNVLVQIWLDRFRLAPSIELDDPRMVSGLQALVAGGILTANRPAQILG